MIKVFGAESCGVCKTVKKILEDEEIYHEYTDIDSLTKGERENWLEIGRAAGNMSLPVIIKEGKSITHQELMKHVFQGNI